MQRCRNCSIGNGFQTTDKESKNGIEIGSIFGAGEADVTYISPYPTYIRTINERLSLSSKITYSVKQVVVMRCFW
jgi:hypothetical protein